MSDRPLTRAEVAVLRAAARGDLWFSGHIHSLYKTFAEHRNVTAAVERIANREVKLLSLGGDSRALRRDWYLTDEGQAELAKHPEEG